MRITIHRGCDQIGGCATEYEINGWKLFVDYGEQLPGAETKPIDIEGLNRGDLSRSALLITHYHNDHVGNITELSDELPIYMGRVSKDILDELSTHLSTVSEGNANLAKRLATVKTFHAGETFVFGDFSITPVTIDHSAFDAYSFKIESEGIKIFHTGDFRTHGFRSRGLFKMLEKYVGPVDYVVCEGTNIARPNATNKSERKIQLEYEKAFRENKGSIVYVSTTNIDRLFSLYHAAMKANRPFYVDAFQKRIMNIVSQGDNPWKKSRFYRYGKYEPITLKYDKNEYLFTTDFYDFLNEKGYVLIARATDRFDNLIEKLPEDKQKYLSMWRGYVNPECKAFNHRLAKSVGNETIYLHTSGHTDILWLFKFFDTLEPKAIIPIHTDHPSKFAELFSEQWPVLLLKDGEHFNPIKDVGYDNITSSILAVKELDENIKIITIEENEKCYSLDDKTIGEFRNNKEALFAIHKSTYAHNRLFGYIYEEIKDMEPWITETYTPDLKLNARFAYGGHSFGEKEFQTNANFKTGDKVLCLIYGFKIIFPAIYEGPITLDYLRDLYEKDDILRIQYDSFEDYIKDGLWDSEWDSVIVRPLVKIDDIDWHERMMIRRPFVFPYQKFDI